MTAWDPLSKWAAAEPDLAPTSLFKANPACPRAHSEGAPTLPSQPSQIGGRLKRYYKGWQLITEDKFLLRTLTRGYRLPFRSRVPLTRRPQYTPLPADPQKRLALQSEIYALLHKGAIEPVYDDSPGFYSRLFVVPKKEGTYRPVIDLKVLNQHLKVPHFKMHTVQTVLKTISPRDYAFTIDLTDAYLHIPVHKRDRKFLRFTSLGTRLQWTCLPFGLATASMVFTRLAHAVAAFLHKRSIHIIPYLDDWLFSEPVSYCDGAASYVVVVVVVSVVCVVVCLWTSFLRTGERCLDQNDIQVIVT